MVVIKLLSLGMILAPNSKGSGVVSSPVVLTPNPPPSPRGLAVVSGGGSSGEAGRLKLGPVGCTLGTSLADVATGRAAVTAGRGGGSVVVGRSSGGGVGKNSRPFSRWLMIGRKALGRVGSCWLLAMAGDKLQYFSY